MFLHQCNLASEHMICNIYATSLCSALVVIEHSRWCCRKDLHQFSQWRWKWQYKASCNCRIVTQKSLSYTANRKLAQCSCSEVQDACAITSTDNRCRLVVCSVNSIFQAVKLLISVLCFNVSYPKLLGGLFVPLQCYISFCTYKRKVTCFCLLSQ